MFEKTKEERKKERRAFNEKMTKKKPEKEMHQHAWCTHEEGEQSGHCDIMKELHFKHFITEHCKGKEEDWTATCPEYPLEELGQVKEEIIN